MSPASAASRTTRRLLRSAAIAVSTLLALLAAQTFLAALPARAANVVTPGDFTGYGFDQCTAPTQAAMDAWLTGSPYWAVGIYISGDSRGCTSQPNLTPTWVSTQLGKGWRLLPITLGPQASCTTRPRYLTQVRIDPAPANAYSAARAQGRGEADKTVAVAQSLGIVAGSTLWYDIESFDTSGTDCRESALSFLSAWTAQLHRVGYVSGIYSSASTGIKMLDDARVNRPGAYLMPDRIWIADWNLKADVFSTFVRDTGWMPHQRVHQYRGGHDETYGGVTINIDNDWVDLGRGSTIAAEPAHCAGAASFNFPSYPTRRIGDTGALVKTIQCQLREKDFYTGTIDGVYDTDLGAAVRRYRVSRGLSSLTVVGPAAWVAMLSQGTGPLLKYGAAETAVRRLQRALNAADAAGLPITGVFASQTTAAVKTYQGDHGLARTGVVTSAVWSKLFAGTP
jgi:Domain of unknown function (DUF1906)/Putative peptidoglycan binding domain